MYYSRLIEKEIELKLRTSGAIVVAGPKFCGKTTTCMLYQKSFIKLNTKQAIAMARMNPKAVLPGETSRLIDEWQKAPDIWNQEKDDLDIKYEFGKYILTGSSTPAGKTEVHHSGAGRIAPVKMRPMSLWESKESKGTVSLRDLFDGGASFPWDLNQDFQLEDAAHLTCRGGWPIAVLAPKDIACRALNIMPEDLMRDLESFGLFFEDLAVRDLRVYAGTLGGKVRHYRDNAGLECDAVVHLEDGRWGAIEIKLGGDELIEAGATSLKTLKSKIEEKSDENSPSFLLVLTAVGGAYKREDGVYVAPINLLKP